MDKFAIGKYLLVEKSTEIYSGNPVWFLLNKKSGDELGRVFMYGPWRKWSVTFEPEVVLTADCLLDVKTFLESMSKRCVEELAKQARNIP